MVFVFNRPSNYTNYLLQKDAHCGFGIFFCEIGMNNALGWHEHADHFLSKESINLTLPRSIVARGVAACAIDMLPRAKR